MCCGSRPSPGHARGPSCCLCVPLRFGAPALAGLFLLLSAFALSLSLLEYGVSVPALVATEAAAAVFYSLLLAAVLRPRPPRLFLKVWLGLKLLLNVTLCAVAVLLTLLAVYKGFRHDVGLSSVALFVCGTHSKQLS